MTTLVHIAAAGSLVGACVRVTLLLCVGWCVTMVIRREAAATRHLVWLCVIIGALWVPFITVAAPVRVDVLPVENAAIELTTLRDARTVGVSASYRSTQIETPATAASRVLTIGQRSLVSRAGTMAGVAWLLGAAIQLLWLVATMRSVARVVSRGRVLCSTDWTDVLVDAATRANVEILPRLIGSSEVETAFAVGLFAPVIVVPSSAEEWSAERRRAVLLHELAHVCRHDLVGHLIANVACAAYWFNPVVWAAARRLRVESELAADDVVLASGVRPADYAQHLLDIVTSLGQRAPMTALAIARPTEFEGRLVAILDRSKRRVRLGLTQRRALAAALGLLTFTIAAVAPARRTSTSESIDAAAAGGRVDADIVTRLHYGTAGVINPMLMLLSDADSLSLTEAQADSLATLNRSYMIGLSAIWSPVPDRYASLHGAHDDRSATAVFRQASRASIDLLLRSVPSVTGLLTADQRRQLPPRVAAYLDSEKLAAIGEAQDGKAVDVFFPNGTASGQPMRRMRGPLSTP